ncbi:MAG: flagellar basal body P-ring protein FlgI, partial [Sedimentisphaerales bacterium]|nr:flagellar basal body P-ring protein FlgI [Sedimentisphaerales bacterium]
MFIPSRKTICLIVLLFVIFSLTGCVEQDKAASKSKTLAAAALGPTIGSLSNVLVSDAIAVEGYGLVGGLNGAGSSECPPQIRAYLKRYIITQLPEHKVDVEKFISSSDTAVVRLEGIIPAGASKNQDFDVKVVALPGSQTISLDGGWLYRAELKAKGTFGVKSKVLATVEGPVFIDKITSSSLSTALETSPDTRAGYILAGGKVRDEYGIRIVFQGRDYRIVSRVRNRLEERFGFEATKAISPNLIEVSVPAKYKGQKQKFASVIKAMYLEDRPEIIEERISTFVEKLVVSTDKLDSEIALEAIGNQSIGKLQALLKSPQEQVRLHAARCMLNLGSDRSLPTLREIAMNKDSSYRIEALEAITAGARRNDAAAISRHLLSDNDFNVKLAACDQLLKLDDVAVTQTRIARSFYLQLVSAERQAVAGRIAQIESAAGGAIFVSRSGKPRVVLFGTPIYCHEDIFVQSDDGSIILNAPSGQKYVSIIRKHPRRPDVILQLRSSFELADIILTLCEEPM